MTPTAIAAKLRQHSPGCLPDDVKDGGDAIILFDQFGDDWVQNTPAISLMLIAAMVMDGILLRAAKAWWVVVDGEAHWCNDADHGGSLGACYKAWCWSRGINDA